MALPEKTEDQLGRVSSDASRWLLRTLATWSSRLPGRLGRAISDVISRLIRNGAAVVAPDRDALRQMQGSGREVIEVRGTDLASHFRTELRKNTVPFVRQQTQLEGDVQVWRFIVPANQLGIVRAALEDATRSRDAQTMKAAKRQDRAREIRSRASDDVRSRATEGRTIAQPTIDRGDGR